MTLDAQRRATKGLARFENPALYPRPFSISMTDAELTAQLDRYKWYHIIPLTPTVSTPGVKDFAKHHAPVLRQMDAIDFRGKRVLDVGCRDGRFCFEAEKRGAAEVLGIDTSLS